MVPSSPTVFKAVQEPKASGPSHSALELHTGRDAGPFIWNRQLSEVQARGRPCQSQVRLPTTCGLSTAPQVSVALQAQLLLISSLQGHTSRPASLALPRGLHSLALIVEQLSGVYSFYLYRFPHFSYHQGPFNQMQQSHIQKPPSIPARLTSAALPGS